MELLSSKVFFKIDLNFLELGYSEIPDGPENEGTRYCFADFKIPRIGLGSRPLVEELYPKYLNFLLNFLNKLKKKYLKFHGSQTKASGHRHYPRGW